MVTTVFDRKRVRLHRDRASATFAEHDFILNYVLEGVQDRLPSFQKTFKNVCVVGAFGGRVASALSALPCVTGHITQADLSYAMLPSGEPGCIQLDEEKLSFAKESFDLVVSVMSAHWVNDIEGMLSGFREILKPGGLLVVTFPGGKTLTELRQVLLEAELAEKDGAAQRVSPFIDVRDAGALLQRAHFINPVSDIEKITICYKTVRKLFYDIRRMGESAALCGVSHYPLSRGLLGRIEAMYRSLFPEEEGIYATVEVVTMTAMRGERKKS